jgi:hydroxymethylbilane synthase
VRGGWSARLPIRIGTRGSALAVAQAGLVADALQRLGAPAELVRIQTSGDRRAPDAAWGEGTFVTAIEQALAAGEVDIAVHSAKDLPTDERPDLRIAAYLPREDPRDALVLPADAASPHDPADRSAVPALDRLSPGAVIGTDSPRRRAFLRARRPDLSFQPLQGNVDTRLRRLDEREADALVLAVAGLRRLGRGERISQWLPIETVPPAAGQGAIAVQVKATDAVLVGLLAGLDDVLTRRAVEAERAFLAATGGGCRAPIGVLCTIDGDRLSLVAGFATVDGRAVAFDRADGSAAAGIALATSLAQRLVARRARMPGAPRVLVTRPEADSRRLVAHLAKLGLAGIVVPAIEIRPVQQEAQTLGRLDGYDWIVTTSASGARFLEHSARQSGQALGEVTHARFAAVGRATASQLRDAGVADVWLPSRARASTVADELPIEPGQRVLCARGSLAQDELPAVLRARGATVDEIMVYETIEAPATSGPLLAAAATAPLQAIIFASPSAVHGLLRLAEQVQMERATFLSLPAICIGPRTAQAAREAGFIQVHEAATADGGSLAELSATALADQRS